MMTLHGCNTMEGAGKDVQAVGSKIENSADRNKR
ncbi:MAG: entericidin A/B family lipoprotein [Lautropia sp.]